MKHFSITYVEYEEGNVISFLLAIISLAPIFAVIGHGSSLLIKRDLHSIALFLGALLCAGTLLAPHHFLCAEPC